MKDLPGRGAFVYIKTVSYDEAQKLYPNFENIPRGVKLYSMHDLTDGRPLAITCDLNWAHGYAKVEEWEVQAMH